jgi:V-type H+-transporting ATPase subunit E
MRFIDERSTQSTQTNKSRLKLLQRREEHLQDLFETARESISKHSEDDGRYQQLLEGLIVQVRSLTFIVLSHRVSLRLRQGYLQLMEPEVTVVARKKDKKVAESAAEGAKNQYKEISGLDVEFTVDNSLSDTM